MATTEIEMPSVPTIETVEQPASTPIVETAARETEGDEPQERQRSPRDDAMQAIIDRREEVRQQEMRDFETQFSASREEAGLPAQPAAAEERPVAAVQPAAAEPAQASQTHRVDLGNGQVVQVSSDELLNLARMGALANVALSQAQQAPQQRAPQPQPAPQQQFQPAQAQPQPNMRDVVGHISRRISFGTPDEVEQAVSDLVQIAQPRPQAPQIDPNRIVLAASQHTMAQMQLQNDLNVIASEFPGIAHSETLGSIAAVELHKVRRDDAVMGRSRSNLDAYREACRRVEGEARRAFGGPASPQPQSGAVPISTALQAAQPTGIAARLERKRAAPSTPASASMKSGMEAAARQPISGSAIVDQMRAARGQPSMR